MIRKVILTFDLEFWYNSKFLKNYHKQNDFLVDDRTEEIIEILLPRLTKYNSHATFFITSELAKKYPKLIKKICASGHEIASHSHSHRPFDELNEQDIRNELQSSKDILEKVTGQKIIGFRAPNFSLNKKSWLMLEVMKQYGYRYDSSIHPLKLFIKQKEIKEIKVSLGGIYFRFLPLWLFTSILKLFSQGKTPVVYFHPNELFEISPQIKSAPWLKKKIKYIGTKKAWKKFEKFIGKFDCITIRQHLINEFNS